MKRLVIVNPNSNTEVTAGIERSVAPWRSLDWTVTCVTNGSGPDTISTDADVAAVAEDLRRAVSGLSADAILVACFSDPGVDALRSASNLAIFGVQESGLLMAMACAPKFGVIALSERAVPRHLARIEKLGFSSRCAGEVGLSGYSALAVGRSDDAFAESVSAGERLKRQGAGAIVLGCAGFGPRRAALEEALGLPVIDPVLAGVALAAGVLIGT